MSSFLLKRDKKSDNTYLVHLYDNCFVVEDLKATKWFAPYKSIVDVCLNKDCIQIKFIDLERTKLYSDDTCDCVNKLFFALLEKLNGGKPWDEVTE